MSITTYERFAETPCPWVPDQPFWEQNANAVTGVLGEVARDFPHAADVVAIDPLILPPKKQREELWKLLMGRQHGNMEQSDGKVDVPLHRAAAYLLYLNEIHYGPHSLTEPTPLDPDTQYHLVGLTGGSPVENTHHLQGVTHNKHQGENVANIVALTGQRLRGVWNLPGEHSVDELFAAVGAHSGTDMDMLARRSPWIRSELRRNGTDWEQPFPTEHEIFRLVGEAGLYGLIDWKSYEDTVHTTAPTGPNEEIRYTDNGAVVVVPPREYGMVTYDLKDGRQLHIMNGGATARPHGMPRATSTSIAEESMQYISIPPDVAMGAIAQAPHLRASIDTAIAYLNGYPPNHIRRFDVGATLWEHTITPLVTALGEIMATMKADYRLRAVLHGKDPNAPELIAI